MLRKLMIVVCLLGVVMVTYGQKKKKDNKDAAQASKTDYKAIGSPMPDFRMVTTKGEHITNKDLANDASLVVMMFNPTCEHCEDQTILFEKNLALFSKTKLVLVAAEMMMPYMEYFENTTNVQNYPAIKYGVDSAGFINNTFTYQPLPQINIYDKERKLVKIFAGGTPIDSLKPYIE